MYHLIFNFSFYLFLVISLISIIFLLVDLRKKFIFFILLVLIYSTWGFLFDLDGIFLVFLTTEFTIFLLFIMSYLQLYTNYNFLRINGDLNFSVVFLLFPFFFNPVQSFFFFSSYYKSLHHVVSSDFYILYYFLFDKTPLLVILLTLIISFFSLFFIIMYFSLKIVKLNTDKKLKNLYFLRKQNLLKQTNFVNKLYTFQK